MAKNPEESSKESQLLRTIRCQLRMSIFLKKKNRWGQEERGRWQDGAKFHEKKETDKTKKKSQNQHREEK